MRSTAFVPALGVVVLVWLGGVRPASADWTLGAFLGSAKTETSSIQLMQPSQSTDVTLSPVRYRSESLEPPLYYAYRVGFFPGSGWLGVEGEFIHLKVIAETAQVVRFDGTLRGETVVDSRPLSLLFERFAMTHGVNLLLANVVVRRGVGARGTAPPRWLVTGRLGAGASVPHAESTIGGRSLERYERGGFAVQAAAGLELRVVGRLYVSGEYKLTHNRQDVSVVDGSARTSLTTHHAVGGVVVHVGAVRRSHQTGR